jgi:hypothetical protein
VELSSSQSSPLLAVRPVAGDATKLALPQTMLYPVLLSSM